LLYCKDKLATIDISKAIFFLNAHANQLLNVPIFWKGVIIDMKRCKLLW